LHGDEIEAYADAGYTGMAKRPEFQDSEVTWYVAEKRGKLLKMPEAPRKTLVARREQVKAQIRAKVEHPFHVVKNLFRHRKVRHRAPRSSCRARSKAPRRGGITSGGRKGPLELYRCLMFIL